MDDHSGVRAALREVGQSVRATIPADLAAVYARARRRRAARMAVLAAGVAVIAASSAFAAQPRTQPPPAPHALASGSVEPTTVGTGPAKPPTEPAAPTVVRTSAAADPRSGPGPQANPGDSLKEICLTRLRWSTVVDDWVTVTYSPDETCAGVTVRFFWASYTVRPDGSAVLYASQEYHLNAATPSVHAHLDIPITCTTYFVVIGEQPVKSVISASVLSERPPQQPGPYPNPKGGPPLSVIWRLPDVCPPPPPPTTAPPPTTDPAPTVDPTPTS